MTKPPATKLRTFWLSGAAAATVFALVVVLHTFAVRTPFPDATRTVSLPSLGRGGIGSTLDAPCPYTWIDGRTLLLTGKNGVYYRIDSEAPAASTQPAAMPHLPVGVEEGFLPAPKPWDAMLLTGAKDARLSLQALTPAGAPIAAEKTPAIVWKTFWDSDGSGWFSIGPSVGGAGVWYVPIHRRPSPRPIASVPMLAGLGRILGVAANGSVWFTFPGRGFSKQIQITAADPRGRMPGRNITLPLPDGAQEIDTQLSPDGRRIASLLYYKQRDVRIGLWRLLHIGPRPREAEWMDIDVADTSDLQLRSVAGVSIQGFPSPGNRTTPMYLRWLPDGASISFVYEGKLYVIPVTESDN